MQKSFLLFIASLFSFCCFSQNERSNVSLKILDAQQLPVSNATVELLQQNDSALLKINMSDSTGNVYFKQLAAKEYIARISSIGYKTTILNIPATTSFNIIKLQSSSNTLSTVTVAARKPFIEMAPGKTIVNLDAGITNVGTTAIEALEKLPGISVDKDGNISLKGRTGVTVLVDGKQTYLDPAQLATLLGGMSATQISQVEIMDQPSSQFDAAGNAGIINIKTKKNKTKGFNGNISTAYSQGFYPKNNNSLQLNYRSGQWNFFANYSVNINRQFTRIYALRTYFENDGSTAAFLEQPSFIKGKASAHNLRMGADYFVNPKTTIGIVINGLALDRNSNGHNTASWLSPGRAADSLIETRSNNNNHWNNAGANLNFKHSFTDRRELSADVDLIGYRIRGGQFFQNTLIMPGSYIEASRADIPSDIRILSARADYAEQLQKWKLKGGLKTSHITTDNLAAYEYLDGNIWKPDPGRTNHFLYTENIHALYGNAETQRNKWTFNSGLRYEMTGYDATQLGNAMVKDSSFSRRYNSLFPSAFLRFEADSNHSFSLSAGRRIDRPAFQKLNPFLFIINKYTYQRGNPFYRPQYTWNIELNHVYKELLVTGISYSITKDYFSQVFPLDSSGIVIYTEGNLGRLQNFGASAALQLSPARWWSLSAQAVLNHKRMEGFIEKAYKARITQVNVNINNQFRFKNGWSAELTGFYTSRSQHDIQEIVDPAGQLSAGISKMILQNKGTLKLAARDILYTQWMKGMTYFPKATEYFKLTRDTRVVTVSFTYRFGKAFKTVKRSQGASSEEIERVGNG